MKTCAVGFSAGLCAVLLGCEAPEAPSCPTEQGLPVFPGAEGFGTTTPAGRGGAVIEVTSLDDAGPGTLREAVAAKGPRIVVFRVGGTITLRSHLEVIEPFLTIAGQTAPGDGILVRSAGVVVFTHDVLIQHLRFRPGIDSPINPEDNDAIAILGKTGDQDGARDVVIDHVSASWGEDELVSTFFGPTRVTVSWSIVAEALDKARHEKGGHSAGLLVAAGSSCVSVHHNLLAHNGFRNPLVQGGGLTDVVNNVVYDWGDLATEITPVTRLTHVNIVGNTYLPGPSTPAGGPREILVEGDHPINHFGQPWSILSPAGEAWMFVRDNRGPHRPSDGADDWSLVDPGPDGPHPAERFDVAPVTTLPAQGAREEVLAKAGATAPRRDPVDARIVGEVRDGSGSIIDTPDEVGGFPSLLGGEPPVDTDHDGMPDAWESARGLSPTDPSDSAGDDDDDGYTNIEEYLHELLPAP